MSAPMPPSGPPANRRATDTQRALLAGLRATGGRATLGDLMAATALPGATIEAEILGALSLVGGHVAVDEQGVLTYRMGRRPRRYGPSPLDRARRALYAGLRFTVYGGLVFVLVAYFFVYVVLLVLALVAAMRAGDCCDCDGDCGGECCCATCDGCDGCAAGESGGPSPRASGEGPPGSAPPKSTPEDAAEARRRARLAALPWATQLDLALGRLRQRLTLRPNAEVRLGVDMTLDEEVVRAKPPIYRAVRDWVFGPPEARPEAADEERNVLAFLRAHAGRVTATEVAWLTGRDLASADGLALDLAARYGGDIEVPDEGVLVYTFERLVTRAAGGAPSDALLAWVRERGGAVTVRETATQLAAGAQEALERLQGLARAGLGRVELGDSTRFVAGPEAPEGEAPAVAPRAAARPYTFAWERLEARPSLHGHPPDSGGWIPALSAFNLVLSVVFLVTVLEDPAFAVELVPLPLAAPALFWTLGVIPLAFSALVLLIPQLRRLAWQVEGPRRRARNAWRAWLLVIYRGLVDGPELRTEEAAHTLFQRSDEAAMAAAGAGLDEARRRLDGEVDAEAGLDRAGGYIYRFDRLDGEQRAAERLRLAFDPATHVAGPAIFDSGDDAW